MKFWFQIGVNMIFIIVKSKDVTVGFILQLIKNVRWRHHWNIWHLSAITKISLLLGRYQESNWCKKIHRTILKIILSTYCAINEPKLKELWNWNAIKSHQLFIWDKCWCLLLYPKQFGQAQNRFRHIKGQGKSLTSSRLFPTNDSCSI